MFHLKTDSSTLEIKPQSTLVMDDRSNTSVRLDDYRTLADSKLLGNACLPMRDIDGTDERLGKLVRVVRCRICFALLIDQQMMGEGDVRNCPSPGVPSSMEGGSRILPEVDAYASMVTRTRIKGTRTLVSISDFNWLTEVYW